MKIKISILALVFLFLISCEGGPQSPFSPELPIPSNPSNPDNPGSLYIYYDIDVTMGIAISDATPFQNENDYMTFYLTVAGFRGLLPLTITHKNPSDSFNEIIKIELVESEYNRWGKNANWQLAQMGSSISEEFLATAQFQCWLQLIPISTEIRIEPTESLIHTIENQITFTGWTVDESKAVYFTIIKE